jgi:hypothetical protein
MGESNIDIAQLISSLNQWETWRIVIIVAVFGMLGGLSNKLSATSKDQTHLLGYIIVGAVAALAVLFIHVPTSGVRLIALALAAGYGGRAILNAVQNRVRLTIAREEVARAKRDGREVIQVGEEAVKYARDVLEYSRRMEKELRPAIKRKRKAFMESLPPRVGAVAAKSPETQADELKELTHRLRYLEKSFKE